MGRDAKRKTIGKKTDKRKRPSTEANSIQLPVHDIPLSRKYQCPFYLANDEESKRFQRFRTFEHNPALFFDNTVMKEYGLHDGFYDLLDKRTWSFHRCPWPHCPRLTLEFFCTVQFEDKKDELTLYNTSLTMNHKIVNEGLLVVSEGLTDWPEGMNSQQFWDEISGGVPYTKGQVTSSKIKDRNLRLVQKFLSSFIFDKAVSTKVSAPELFLLWGLKTGTPINETHVLFNAMRRMLDKDRQSFGFGHIIYQLALLFPTIVFQVQREPVITPPRLGKEFLRKSGLLQTDATLPSGQAPSSSHVQVDEPSQTCPADIVRPLPPVGDFDFRAFATKMENDNARLLLLGEQNEAIAQRALDVGLSNQAQLTKLTTDLATFQTRFEDYIKRFNAPPPSPSEHYEDL